RTREDAGHALEAGAVDAGLLGELAGEARAQGLAPLQRAAGQRPGAGVGAPDQEPAAVVGVAGDDDAHDRTAPDVAQDLAPEGDHAARDAVEPGHVAPRPARIMPVAGLKSSAR